MQKTKNIRLLIILFSLIVITIITILLKDSEDTLNVNKNIFSYSNTEKINKVVLESDNAKVALSFTNNEWLVNDRYQADPQRISVLFAIIQQVTVRRQASNSLKVKLDSLFNSSGITVRLFNDDKVSKQFMVAGDELENLTYMKEYGSDTYFLVEIPGYRSYLAALFQLDANGWRNPLVFNINWSNLQAVQVEYVGKKENDFNIIFNKGSYGIEGLAGSDSLKLIDFLDNVSLIYVNDFMTDKELESYDSAIAKPLANINIQDVGRNNYTLTIYNKLNKGNYLVKIDSLEYAVVEAAIITKVMKPKSFFSQENRHQ